MVIETQHTQTVPCRATTTCGLQSEGGNSMPQTNKAHKRRPHVRGGGCNALWRSMCGSWRSMFAPWRRRFGFVLFKLSLQRITAFSADPDGARFRSQTTMTGPTNATHRMRRHPTHNDAKLPEERLAGLILEVIKRCNLSQMGSRQVYHSFSNNNKQQATNNKQ